MLDPLPLNEAIIRYRDGIKANEELNELLDSNFKTPTNYMYFTKEQKNISSKEFRKLYDKKSVGISYWKAYNMVTEDYYEYRIVRFFKVIFSPITWPLYWILYALEFLFIENWKWTIPIVISLIGLLYTIIEYHSR